VDHESSQTGASLSASTDSREQAALHSHVDISVFKDNDGVVTSEFEEGLSESFTNLLGNSLTNSSGASE